MQDDSKMCLFDMKRVMTYVYVFMWKLQIQDEWKKFQRLKRLDSDYVHLTVNDNVNFINFKMIQIV